MAEANDVIIIGCGPAGLSAAIYLKRADRDFLLIEEGEPGGLVADANFVENYPGFPEGIDGFSLRNRFLDHLRSLDIPHVESRVKKVRRLNHHFSIETENSDYESSAVIIAAGTRPKKIRVKGAKAFEGKKVFYSLRELLLDSQIDQRIIVLGGGDIAFDYAINLRTRGHRVTIISRSVPKCLPLLRRRAEERGIDLHIGYSPLEILEKDDSIALSCDFCGEAKEIRGDKILIACGRVPNLEILDSKLRRHLYGKGLPETGIPGLYLVGDIARKRYRQIGIAIGDGLLAAMMADSFLKKRGRR